MSTTRFLARTGAALVVIAALSVGTTSAAYADKPADKGPQAQAPENKGQAKKQSPQEPNQGSTNHSCDGSHHSDTGHGANTDGPANPYHNTCDEDVASDNGNGDGAATGRPAAGTVGNADDKNPPGQAPGPQDHNNGYECDGNQGIAKGNPAHTGCATPAAVTEPEPTKVTCPDGTVMTEDVNHDGVVNAADCTKVDDVVKVTCPNGTVMTEDVNHDGVVNAADCTKVDDVVKVTCPDGKEMTEDVNHDGVINTADCTKVDDVVKVTCPDGKEMTEDVNHDGVINTADCAQVLASGVTKPAPVKPAAVGGVRIDRRPITVAGTTLPLTGGQARSLFAYAAMLIAAGSVLLSMGSRFTGRSAS